MRVAREAPDGSLRNAGLALLSRLAARRPRAVLDHVLQVCMVRGRGGVWPCCRAWPLVGLVLCWTTCCRFAWGKSFAGGLHPTSVCRSNLPAGYLIYVLIYGGSALLGRLLLGGCIRLYLPPVLLLGYCLACIATAIACIAAAILLVCIATAIACIATAASGLCMHAVGRLGGRTGD